MNESVLAKLWPEHRIGVDKWNGVTWGMKKAPTGHVEVICKLLKIMDGGAMYSLTLQRLDPAAIKVIPKMVDLGLIERIGESDTEGILYMCCDPASDDYLIDYDNGQGCLF